VVYEVHDRRDTDHGDYISLFWIAGNFEKLSDIRLRKSEEIVEAILETSFKFVD